MTPRKADRTCVVFGAGALGLGFLGPELGRDYEMVYVDIPDRAGLLEYMNDSHEYTYNETGPSARTVSVDGVRGINTADGEAVQAALQRADLVFTAVGEPNLSKVAPSLARAAAQREPERPLRVLCCENGLEIARKLTDHIESALGGAGRRLIVGDTVMGRMCMIVSPPEGGLAPVGPELDWAVAAEPFFGIPVPRRAMEGLQEPGAAFQVMGEGEFAAREDVKMLAHNGLHAFLAFLGQLRGKQYYCELSDDSRIMGMARDMLLGEVGEALLRKHGAALDHNFYHNYAVTILRRVVCPGFHDSLARGARAVMRKLQPGERLVEGVRMIAAQGLSPQLYATGLVAAIAVARRTRATELSFHEVLRRHCGLREDEEADLIELAEDRRSWLGREFGLEG